MAVGAENPIFVVGNILGNTDHATILPGFHEQGSLLTDTQRQPGSLADMRKIDVRFTPDSGRMVSRGGCPLSARSGHSQRDAKF
jgi:hypothetical protein